jgi:hypothetical protein
MELFKNSCMSASRRGVIGGIAIIRLPRIKLLFGLPWSAACRYFWAQHYHEYHRQHHRRPDCLRFWQGIERSGWSKRLKAWRTS